MPTPSLRGQPYREPECLCLRTLLAERSRHKLPTSSVAVTMNAISKELTEIHPGANPH